MHPHLMQALARAHQNELTEHAAGRRRRTNELATLSRARRFRRITLHQPRVAAKPTHLAARGI